MMEPLVSPTSLFSDHLHQHIRIAKEVLDSLRLPVDESASLLIDALAAGRKVLFCGNGGSAADAQHLAAELTGRYRAFARRALPALALSTDSSAVTAIGNDMGYDQVFARQVQAHGHRDDVLVGISTSGRSPNVIAAVIQARALGLKTIGLVGRDGGELATLVDIPIIVPAESTAHIQEMHIVIGHILCEAIDTAFCPEISAR